MFPDLLYPLVRYFTPLNVFQYITFRAAYAAVTALLLSFLLGPPVIAHLRRRQIGQEIRGDGPETHQVKSGTPTMGGLLILGATVISVLLWQSWRNPYTWIGLGSLFGFGAIGFLDDLLKKWRRNSTGLRGWFKIIGQVSVATAVVVLLMVTRNQHTSLLYVPMLKEAVVDLSILYVPFGVILLVGMSNAVNLTDGLDGLAAGLVIMVGLAFAAIAYLTGRVDYAEYLQIPLIPGAGEMTVFLLALVGGTVGFLWFNAHPAEIMMGDTGSLALGGVLGTAALILKKELLFLVVGGVFVIEAASVMIQVVSYKTRKKRVFLMAPLHHHFELKGWAESKVVLRFWVLGGLFAILGLSTLKLR